MKLLLSLLPMVLIASSLFGQSTWYVSQQSGSDSNSGQSTLSPYETIAHALNGSVQPGDTVKLMGLFHNDSFDPAYSYSGNISDPHIWHGENSIRINNLDGAPGAYITFMAFDSNTVLRGDGGNILRVSNSSYLRFVGFEVAGQVDSIPLATALALQFLWDSSGTVVHRVPPGTPDSIVGATTFPVLGSVPRPSYTDTRGIYLSNVHHIDLLENQVHHMPGGGIRVSECDYINIIGNEIHNCSRKSFSGTHALVVTKANSFDSLDTHKINILRNEVHHNYNEIYSWAPTKSIITPHIDEGKGISLQRNDTVNGNWRHGRFLVANNIAYWNGYSGVHSNGGMRMDFVNNTCYMNSYTKSVTYAGTTSGGNIGISTSDGDDIRIVNNISVIDGNLGGNAIAAANTIGLVVSENIIHGTPGPINEDPDVVAVQVNTQMVDPLFVDPANFDFQLQANSPAKDAGDTNFAPSDDFFGQIRDANPDLGAIEFLPLIGFDISASPLSSLSVHPNPGRNLFVLRSEHDLSGLKVYDMQGRAVGEMVNRIEVSSHELRLDFQNLPAGMYFLRTKKASIRLLKL